MRGNHAIWEKGNKISRNIVFYVFYERAKHQNDKKKTFLGTKTLKGMTRTLYGETEKRNRKRIF